MTPSLDRRPEHTRVVAREVGETRAVRWFGVFLLAAALVAGAALLVAGQPLPPIAPVLLLAALLALSINRVALFPSELAATAEAAAILASVVAFHEDAALLGPWSVALLVGPLDVVHWEQRAFTRMAHNAGDRALATLAAAATFGTVASDADLFTIRFGLAAIAAALVFTVVEIVFDVVLLRLRGEPAGIGTVEHAIAIDALTVPLCLIGVGAGVLALDVGWWAAAVVLLPASLIPELVFVRVRRAWRRPDWCGLTWALALGAATLVLATHMAVGDIPRLAVLLALAVALGAEQRVDRRSPVPVLTALLVGASLIVIDPAHAMPTVVLVAVATTVSSWRATPARAWPTTIRAATAVAIAAIVSALAFDALVGTLHPMGSGLVAGLVFGVVVSLLASRRRAVDGALVLWSLPIVGAAVALASMWNRLARVGAAAFVLGIALVLGASAWWAVPSWRSRWLGPALQRSGRAFAPIAIAVLVISGVACSFLARDAGPASLWLGALGLALQELVVVLAMGSVRQWRFQPGRRSREVVALAFCAALLVLVGGAPREPTLARVLAGTIVVVSAAYVATRLPPLRRPNGAFGEQDEQALRWWRRRSDVG